MKYLKKYERLDYLYDAPRDIDKWEIGDSIFCINPTKWFGLTYGKEYKILHILKEPDGIHIKIKDDDNNTPYYSSDRFVSEDEWNEIKFNL